MLEFYYDFLDYYFNRKDLELLQMDTDSLYIAWSGENIDDLVKPEYKKKYNNGGNKTNDLILNLTPENVTQHSRIE